MTRLPNPGADVRSRIQIAKWEAEAIEQDRAGQDWPDAIPSEDDEQAAALAEWARQHPGARRLTWRHAIRDFCGLLLILATLGWLFFQWVQPGGWLR